MTINTIYLDMDGVMFNFEERFRQLFGVEPHHVTEDDVFWKMVHGVPDYFENMPLFEDAHTFFDYVSSVADEVVFLTACPKSHYKSAALQKIKAVRKNFGEDVRVLPVLGGQNKFLFMHMKGDLLIDDTEKCVRPWIEHGGEAILHSSFENTYPMVELWEKHCIHRQ